MCVVFNYFGYTHYAIQVLNINNVILNGHLARAVISVCRKVNV